MSEEYFDRFLEVLNSTFLTCDENGSGFVETNKLIDSLISQEPSWMDNETIREELNKVLRGDLNYVISKEDFIKSLQGWVEASFYQDMNLKNEYNINSEAGKCSSSTSGIGEPVEITSGSSTNSMEDIYSGTNFVTDEQTFTNEDLVDETSFNDSGSSQADYRLVLQSEISTLIRKNEYLENLNDSLLAQVACLEDTVSKKKDESEDYKNQLDKINDRLELQILKNEETEDKMNSVVEENKSFVVQLSQFERENSKLKTTVSHLEDRLENSLSENRQKSIKLEEVTEKLSTIDDLYNNSMQLLAEEKEKFSSEERDRENTLREVILENKNLQSQLDSNYSFTEDLKCQLRAALKELSDMKSKKIKNVMNADYSQDKLLTEDDSMVYFDEKFSLDPTIPYETSLLAELKSEVKPDKKDCCCVCKQSVSVGPQSPDTVHAAVGTYTETVDKSTMTGCHTLTSKPTKCIFCSNVEHKEVGVECSFKVISLKRKILSKIGICQRTREDLM